MIGQAGEGKENAGGAIALVPVGAIPADLLTWLAGRMAELLGRDILIGDEIPLPQKGYDPRRRQYLGETILVALRAFSSPAAGRVLGIAEADSYAPGLNFIFGQAMLNGREAFVALPRLRSSFYGMAEDPDLYRRRILKECVHELGHTWGLRHCRNARCAMRFSNSLLDTDAKGAAFCSRCRESLEGTERRSRP